MTRWERLAHLAPRPRVVCEPGRWYAGFSIGGNHLRAMVLRWKQGTSFHATLSYGATADHARSDWRLPYYSDLEVTLCEDKWGHRVTDVLPTGGTGLVCHVERGHRTYREARAHVRWLRSCIERAGIDGILALNERSKGEFA